MPFNFSTEIAVRFAETDAQGIVHNAEYLVWFEVARIEYLRRFRGGYRVLRDEGSTPSRSRRTRVIARLLDSTTT